MNEPRQNLIGLLGHMLREVLDGQFFALIVRLVGNGWCSSSVMSKSSGSFGNDAAMSLHVELQDNEKARVKSDKVPCCARGGHSSIFLRYSPPASIRRWD